MRPVEAAMDRERRFTGAASHELRTPLTALRGEIEVTLRRERTPGEYAATLRRMEGLVARMSGVVEGLLVLTRARSGHLLVGAGTFTVEELGRAIDEVIRLLPGSERVAFTCSATEAMAVAGDSLLVALAVRNLVENALVHAPGSGVRVTLSSADGRGVRCDVEDTGPGLPVEVEAGRDGILSSSRSGGAGLGLSIARAIVEAHGGEVRLANRAEGGCIASIRLPASPGSGRLSGQE
jgi:two-component system OmpR family sensor kinase